MIALEGEPSIPRKNLKIQPISPTNNPSSTNITQNTIKKSSPL